MMNALITPRRGFAILGLGSIALVFVAVGLTEALQLSPCPLCIFQRMLYLLLGAFALVAAIWPRTMPWSGGLALLTAVGGASTALYQSWMQAHPESAMQCGIAEPTLIERLVDWSGQQIPWLFYAWGECASREWVLFGLSLANWSALVFLGLIGGFLFLLFTGRAANSV